MELYLTVKIILIIFLLFGLISRLLPDKLLNSVKLKKPKKYPPPDPFKKYVFNLLIQPGKNGEALVSDVSSAFPDKTKEQINETISQMQELEDKAFSVMFLNVHRSSREEVIKMIAEACPGHEEGLYEHAYHALHYYAIK